MTTLRIWAEELEPEQTLQFTWSWQADVETDVERESERIIADLANRAGIISIVSNDVGVVIKMDPEGISRPELAELIREALGGDKPEQTEAEEFAESIRVWVEDLSNARLRLTWHVPDSADERDVPTDRRRVASWLSVQPAIQSVRIDTTGVIVDYVPERLERPDLGAIVRKALTLDEDLKTRANDLLKRAPTYGNLARKLALDERISPLPGAARKAGTGSGGVGGNMARRTASRMIPGLGLITRIQTLLPVIQELSAWSREAPPEIVDEHLQEAGLDRATIEADNATATEARLFARDFAGEKASEFTGKASTTAKRALEAGRDWFETQRSDFEEASKKRDEDDRNPA